MKIDFENSSRLYYSIKEVADHFGVTQALLRSWEKEFKSTIKPRKSEGGTRQYSKEDINNIALVFHLVKEKGMKLEGARQMLRQRKDEYSRKMEAIEKLEIIRRELKEIEKQFDSIEE